MVTMLRRRPRCWICDVVRAVASSRRGDVTLASHDGHALDRHVWTLAWPADRPDVAARRRDVTHDWRSVSARGPLLSDMLSDWLQYINDREVHLTLDSMRNARRRNWCEGV